MKKTKFMFLLIFLFLTTINLYSFNPFTGTQEDEHVDSPLTFFGFETYSELSVAYPYIYYGDSNFQESFTSDYVERTSFFFGAASYLKLPDSKLLIGAGVSFHFDHATLDVDEIDYEGVVAYVRYLYISVRGKYFFDEVGKGFHILGGVGGIYSLIGAEVRENKPYKFDIGIGYALRIYKKFSFTPSIDYSFTPIADLNASAISINIKFMF